MPARDKRVDAYIANSAEFARPILQHLRDLVHKGCPNVQEEMKWSRPFFLYRDVILCNVSAFKQHCSFGFWGAEIGKTLQAGGMLQDGGMGSLGRITGLKDLPSDKKLLDYIRQAARFIDEGKGENRIVVARRIAKPVKPPLEVPLEFTTALSKNKAATKVFDAFSPSCKREYVEWIAEARRPETRDRRIAQAIDWIADGKQRNWKYQNC